MGLIRLIVWGVIFYFVYRLVSNLLKPRSSRPEVRGRPKTKPPIDLDGQDIEDAKYKEL
jgi:hypothetical protein